MKIKFNQIFSYAITDTLQNVFIDIGSRNAIYEIMRQNNLTIFDEAKSRLLYNLS